MSSVSIAKTQCLGITKYGVQCTRNIKPDETFCVYHKGMSINDKGLVNLKIVNSGGVNLGSVDSGSVNSGDINSGDINSGDISSESNDMSNNNLNKCLGTTKFGFQCSKNLMKNFVFTIKIKLLLIYPLLIYKLLL
jgi:hypothetical protein